MSVIALPCCRVLRLLLLPKHARVDAYLSNRQNTAAELARAVSAADAHLKASSDQAVQLWALVCLLRAAEASGAYLSCASHRFRHLRGRSHGQHAITLSDVSASRQGDVGSRGGNGDGLTASEDARELLDAWRLTWGTIFHTDQRFSNLTSRCERGTVGEAVVALLGACMRERLVDSAFVTKEQVRVEAGRFRHRRKLVLVRQPGSSGLLCSTI